jgi:hypothetical protein
VRILASAHFARRRTVRIMTLKLPCKAVSNDRVFRIIIITTRTTEGMKSFRRGISLFPCACCGFGGMRDVRVATTAQAWCYVHAAMAECLLPIWCGCAMGCQSPWDHDLVFTDHDPGPWDRPTHLIRDHMELEQQSK